MKIPHDIYIEVNSQEEYKTLLDYFESQCEKVDNRYEVTDLYKHVVFEDGGWILIDNYKQRKKVEYIDIIKDYLLLKAKQRYPIGTKYISAFNGDKCIVKEHLDYYYNQITDGCGGSVYYDGKWAEIIENGLIKGEIYYHNSNYEWISKYISTKDGNVLDGGSIEINEKEFYDGGICWSIEEFKKGLRPATQEEKYWLNACIEAGKYIEKPKNYKVGDSIKNKKVKVKQIEINHPSFGNIIINSVIPEEIMQKIGDVTGDYSKSPVFYYSSIIKNEDGTFCIKNLMVIKPESVNVGWMENSKGNKTFITVIVNRKAGDNIVIYPRSILSVIYE